MGGVVVIHAFGKGCIRWKTNGSPMVFPNKATAEKFLIANNIKLKLWNFFELDSPYIFAKEDVDYLSEIQNWIIDKDSEDEYIDKGPFSHRLKFITEMEIGLHRIEKNGRGVYKKTLNIWSYKGEKLDSIAPEKLSVYMEIPEFRDKFNRGFIYTKMDMDWIQDQMQDLYKITKHYYFDESTGRMIYQYSAKFFKMVDRKEWKKYPYISGSKICDRK